MNTRSEPKWRDIDVKPSIDFVKLKVPQQSLPKLGRRLKYEPAEPGTLLLTLQDPTQEDLLRLGIELEQSRLVALEISIDFRPPKRVRDNARAELLYFTHRWIASHLYPWKGPGLQRRGYVTGQPGREGGQWVFGEPSSVKRTWEEPVDWGTTLYLGHSDSQYASAETSNFASMRVYRKQTDAHKVMTRLNDSVRVEVTFAEEGMEHFGLNQPLDLLSFKFRRLSPYFQFAQIDPSRWRSLGMLPRLQLLQAYQVVRDVGISALPEKSLLQVKRDDLMRSANRKVADALDNLSRRY